MRYKKYLLPFISLAVILAGAYLAIQIGKGYRPSREGLTGTGLLAANSFPSGAEVYIDDRLTTATDTTINLKPGEYSVTIKKDGYIPWTKTLNLEAELVTQTNAQLFRSIPSLAPLTLTGADQVYPSPNGQKIAYLVTSASTPARNGLYILDLNSSAPLLSKREPRQIARTTNRFNLNQAEFLWSPSSNQILIHYDPTRQTTSSGGESLSIPPPSQGGGQVGVSATQNFLLDINRFNELETAPDVTARLSLILSDWEEEIVQRETKQFALLPPPIQAIATMSATNVYFSPNEEKLLYTATGYAVLPNNITTNLPASNTQPQSREIDPGGVYVYDRKEDRNFKLDTIDLAELDQKPLLLLNDYQQTSTSAANLSVTQINQLPISYDRFQSTNTISQTIQLINRHYSPIHTLPYQWFPTSNHLLKVMSDSIEVVEYDNTNRNPLYAGPFDSGFVYPWPDGSRLVIVTNLNSSHLLPNLYAIEIK